MFLRVPDHEIFDNYDTECKVIEAMRKVKPNIVITHDPNDYDRDHWMTSHLVLQCLNSAALKHFKTESPSLSPIEKIGAVYFCDTVGSLRFDPEVWIDITDTMGRKIKALRAHKTQLKFMKYMNMDLVRFITATARFRGTQANVKYAEAFRRLKFYSRIQALTTLPK